MRKLLLSTVIAAGLTFGGVGIFAQEGQQQQRQRTKQITQLEGEVNSAQGNILVVEDQEGDLHSFKVSDQQKLRQLKRGDKIQISIQKSQ